MMEVVNFLLYVVLTLSKQPSESLPLFILFIDENAKYDFFDLYLLEKQRIRG